MTVAADGGESATVDEEEVTKEAAENAATDETTDLADETVVVTIGEESPPSEEEERAPDWVRELRKTHKEKVRELQDAREEIHRLKAPAPSTALGDKPTLESCGYDEATFETKLDAWKDRKRAIDAEGESKRRADEAAKAAWDAKLATYGTAKTELKVKDFEDAEAAATEVLSQTQQAIVVKGAKNPALVIYALGKNPKEAKRLASIADPVEFAFAVAELETKLKVTPRKAAPLPESVVRGSGPISGVTDSTLARLEAEAEKTGDRSKIAAYRRSKRPK